MRGNNAGPAAAAMGKVGRRPAMQSHLMKTLTETNKATGGLLPPATCHSPGTTVVTCTNPHFAVNTVTFRTYPSQQALYAAYIAAVRALGNRQGGNSIQVNFGNCGRLCYR